MDMLPHLFATLDTHYTLPRPWEDTMQHLCGTQLGTDWVATGGGAYCANLVPHPTLSWLSASFMTNIIAC